LVNIVGGCCGTTEAYIALIAKACRNVIPHINNLNMNNRKTNKRESEEGEEC